MCAAPILPSSDSQLLHRQMANWADGVRSELRYWRRSLREAVKHRPQWYVDRTQPHRPVYPVIAPLLPTSGPVRILDVGAGPLTFCGNQLAGRNVEIVAVDPLAQFYEQIWNELGVQPPIQTRVGFAEDLSTRFADGSFDAVVCVNALDHSIDPVRALIEMLIVTKVGGTIFLNHSHNESLKQGGHGLHQWNIDFDDGEFVVWNSEHRLNVTRQFQAFSDAKTRLHADRIEVLLTKRASPVADFAEFHRVCRQPYLDAFMSFVASHHLPPPFGAPSVRWRALKTLVRFR